MTSTSTRYFSVISYNPMNATGKETLPRMKCQRVSAGFLVMQTSV